MNRREFVAAGTATLAATALRAAETEAAETIGHGEFRYTVDAEWGARHLDPAKNPVFNCHEMVIDGKGRLIMLGDDVRNNVLIYDRSGELLDSWGTEYPGGHGLTLFHEGDKDVLYIVDCGWYNVRGKWNRQQGRVVKTDLTGKVLLTIGHPLTYGAYEPGMNYQPTETAIAPNGDIYIADGYGSDYILRFDANGRYISKFGGQKAENPDARLQNAHGIAMDLRDAAHPTLIATSRSQNCFKRFTLDGTYIETIAVPGAFVCRPVLHGDNLYAGVCWSTDPKSGKREANSGFVTILNRENRVVSNPGGSEPVYTDGKLAPVFQATHTFKHGHDVCPDADGNLFVCQWNAGRTYPIKLARV